MRTPGGYCFHVLERVLNARGLLLAACPPGRRARALASCGKLLVWCAGHFIAVIRVGGKPFVCDSLGYEYQALVPQGGRYAKWLCSPAIVWIVCAFDAGVSVAIGGSDLGGVVSGNNAEHARVASIGLGQGAIHVTGVSLPSTTPAAASTSPGQGAASVIQLPVSVRQGALEAGVAASRHSSGQRALAVDSHSDPITGQGQAVGVHPDTTSICQGQDVGGHTSTASISPGQGAKRVLADDMQFVGCQAGIEPSGTVAGFQTVTRIDQAQIASEHSAIASISQGQGVIFTVQDSDHSGLCAVQR